MRRPRGPVQDELETLLGAGAPGPAGDAFTVRLALVAGLVEPRSTTLGWATVDLDRAAAELVRRLATRGPGPVRAAPPDELLGASCRRLSFAAGGELLLLEPAREGRLTAALARFGEGPLVRYLHLDGARTDAARLAAVPMTVEGEGPFGRQRLVKGGPAWGPHVVLVLAVSDAGPGAGTIST